MEKKYRVTILNSNISNDTYLFRMLTKFVTFSKASTMITGHENICLPSN